MFLAIVQVILFNNIHIFILKINSNDNGNMPIRLVLTLLVNYEISWLWRYIFSIFEAQKWNFCVFFCEVFDGF